jgi:glycerophosphoryl diester phosphodiesterase
MKFLISGLFLSSSVFSFDWQGHRGARGLYPENTIGAMSEALKYPVSTLELDVVISKDKRVVVSHEPWMNPEMCLDPDRAEIKTEKQVNLYRLSYEEIQKYDCGSKVHPRFKGQVKVSVGKPLLSSLLIDVENKLRDLRRTNVSYNVEIKSTIEDESAGFQPPFKEFTDLVVKTIREYVPKERFILQSFDKRVLRYLHEKYPDLRVSALQEEKWDREALMKEWGFLPETFSPDYHLLTKEDIDFFHSKNVTVIPWTINSVEDMNKLIKLGVDGIITDYPNLISTVGLKKCRERTSYFEGKCVEIPIHSRPSRSNPGWVCKDGYVQKRNHCEKIRKPAHSIFLEDGKTWVCKDGYKRYRSKCVPTSNVKKKRT